MLQDNQLFPREGRQEVSICIVGKGIRGASVLERIVAHARKDEKRTPLDIQLVDPHPYGPPQYDSRQPDWLLLNIVCSQVSLFPESISAQGAEPIHGPSLFRWATDRGIRIPSSPPHLMEQGRLVGPDDFLPRRLMGEYLRWFFLQMEQEAPHWCRFTHYNSKANDIRDGMPYVVRLEDETEIEVDFLFLTVGEELAEYKPHSNSGTIAPPYPLPERLAKILPQQHLAIAGLGLTMVDAVLGLTIGRGGRFVSIGDDIQYLPSGKEPWIMAFSRSGIPYRARPARNDVSGYKALVFTRPAIDRLRAEFGPQLDYDLHVLPLLILEIRAAFHRARAKLLHGPELTEELEDFLRRAAEQDKLPDALATTDAKTGETFDARALYFGEDPAITMALSGGGAAYQRWFVDALRRDINEAELGTTASPLKAALETCRELRDVIRYAVNFQGLTETSADRFFTAHAAALNRIGVGPQLERAKELVALIDQGILQVSMGPSPNVRWDTTLSKWRVESTALAQPSTWVADGLYHASLNQHRPSVGKAGILARLSEGGMIRPYSRNGRATAAIDVCPAFHPFSRSGQIQTRVWIFGLATEGVTFYNGYVPSPGKHNASSFDADRALLELFQVLQTLPTTRCVTAVEPNKGG